VTVTSPAIDKSNFFEVNSHPSFFSDEDISGESIE